MIIIQRNDNGSPQLNFRRLIKSSSIYYQMYNEKGFCTEWSTTDVYNLSTLIKGTL